MFEQLTAQDFDSVFALMQLSFPDDEFRTREGQRALLDNPVYRLYGLRAEDGRLAALCAAWQLEQVLFIEHLAVDPTLRSGGLGGRLLDELVASSEKPVFLEVEPPQDTWSRRRIGFYERHGFFLNEYPYLQLPLREGQSPKPLLVMTSGAPLSEKTFALMRDEVYARVYNAAPANA